MQKRGADSDGVYPSFYVDVLQESDSSPEAIEESSSCLLLLVDV